MRGCTILLEDETPIFETGRVDADLGRQVAAVLGDNFLVQDAVDTFALGDKVNVDIPPPGYRPPD